jgi:signal transduction histidine kinase
MYRAVLSNRHAITMVGPTGIRVIADQERIGQVLRNLVNNAIKYSPDGTPVEVRAIPEGSHVRMEVEDQGYGIAEEDQQVIFECFGRGRDSRTLNLRGSGLGLYLSRRIVEAHGSELRVASVPDQGSTFSFDLRVAT